MVDIYNRLEQLKSEWCDYDTFKCIYGIDILSTEANDIKDAFVRWSESFKRKRNCFSKDNDGATIINRWLFELFLQRQNLLTTHMAGIQLAMTKEDMAKVISTMKSKDMPFSGWWLKYRNDVIDASFLSNLSSYFPSLRYTFFSDRYVYIQRLHEAIKQDLDIQIDSKKPFYYDIVDDKERGLLYATEYDILTDEPFESHDQVWLDFKKPLALKPDICSIFTYARYEQELKQYLFSPNCIDEEDLSRAKQLLGKR